MSPSSILESESRLLESIAGRLEQQAQLPTDALTSGSIEYRATWTGLPLAAAAASLSSSHAEAQNPFSGVGSLNTEDVQVVVQSVRAGVQQCVVGADSSFVLLTHNSQGRRLTTGGHVGLFRVSYHLID